jgi:vanillate O-demethylase ferredoxin subunit
LSRELGAWRVAATGAISEATMTLSLLVKSIAFEAADVVSLDLRSAEGGELPPFTAGAHIDLQLRNGLARSYSLCNPQSERHRYVIAVQKDVAGRGGSAYVHDFVRPGQVLAATAPRNDFPLVEDAEESVFFAGGIGITPVWCMVQRLQALGRRWRLYYAVRNRARAAFLDRIVAVGAPGFHLHVDDEAGGGRLDVPAAVSRAKRAQLYCCGPAPMLRAFKQVTAGLPKDRIHIEYFSARELAAASAGFDVVLAKRNRTVRVAAGQTIIAALRDNGIVTAHSCLEGVCGACETSVLDGVPEHRDLVLGEPERALNRTMMICCSGCKGDRLVLDL